MPRCRPRSRDILALALLAPLVAAAAACTPREPAPKPPAAAETADGTGDGTAASAPASASAPRRLVVLLIVDQLAAWWFEEYRAHYEHGVGRLLAGGVYYPALAYPYAVSFTTAGHATLATGAPPSVSGLAANYPYRPELGRSLPAPFDPESPVFTLAGAPASGPYTGRSGASMRVGGVADALEAATGGRSHTVAISVKDRSAAFGAGRKPDIAVWYDDEQPAMTTSAFYVDQVPAWLRALAGTDIVRRHLDEVWTPLPGFDHAALSRGADDASGESDKNDGLGNTFPHDIGRSSEPAAAMRLTPAGDALVWDTARAAMDAYELGTDEVPDLLVLSFSSHDHAGHAWGPHAWERLDLFARFDRELATFLGQLDQRLGRDGYALVLTSDHGIVPLVERTGAGARRVQRSDIAARAERALVAALGAAPGAGAWVRYADDNILHLAAEFDALSESKRERGLDAAAGAIAAIAGVGYVERIARVRGDCEARTGMARLVCFSIVPDEPGVLYYAAAEGSIITGYQKGTNHGSPSALDREVPGIVYAPGHPRWGASRTVAGPLSTLQVAPTLSALLGIAPPPQAKAAPLP